MAEQLWSASLKKQKDFKIIYKKQIGKGSYGEVWLAEWNGLKVAVKRIHKEFFERMYDEEIIDDRIREFRKECDVLQALDHPNIVKMHKASYPVYKSPLIIMELMHYDLLNYIKDKSNPKLSPSEIVSIALGIAEGLEYLHGLVPPVIHRDIATKNILLTKELHPKIADLGVAKIFNAVKETCTTPMKGTPLYSAPETYKNIKNFEVTYGVKADIFSFGVVLLEMSVGHELRVLPASSPSGKGKTTELQRRKNDIDEMKDHMLKQIVTDCLQEKPSKRPSASKIVTTLRRIRDEREMKKWENEKAVTFERLCQKPPSSQQVLHFKALLLGNCNVGKSTLFQLLRDQYLDIESVQSTISIESVKHYFKYNATIVGLELVDTSGEEKHFSLTCSYYRNVDGVFLVYDVSDRVTLQSLPFWVSSLKKYNNKDNPQMLLVGNKVDLRETMKSKEMVPKDKALEFSSGQNCPYVETSAKDIDSVMAMYKKMVEILVSTVSPEDGQFQEKNEAGGTIKLQNSRDSSVQGNKSCSSC